MGEGRRAASEKEREPELQWPFSLIVTAFAPDNRSLKHIISNIRKIAQISGKVVP